MGVMARSGQLSLLDALSLSWAPVQRPRGLESHSLGDALEPAYRTACPQGLPVPSEAAGVR